MRLILKRAGISLHRVVIKNRKIDKIRENSRTFFLKRRKSFRYVSVLIVVAQYSYLFHICMLGMWRQSWTSAILWSGLLFGGRRVEAPAVFNTKLIKLWIILSATKQLVLCRNIVVLKKTCLDVILAQAF